MSTNASPLCGRLNSLLDQRVLDEIASRTGVVNAKANRRAVGIALPMVVKRLHESARAERGGDILVNFIDGVRSGSINGAELASHLFADQLPKTAQHLATHCDITPGQGQATVIATGQWALMTASSFVSGPQELASRLAAPDDQQKVAWTNQVQVAEPVIAASATETTPVAPVAVTSESGKKFGTAAILAGTALVAALLFGGIFALSSGGDDESPVELAVEPADVEVPAEEEVPAEAAPGADESADEQEVPAVEPVEHEAPAAQEPVEETPVEDEAPIEDEAPVAAETEEPAENDVAPDTLAMVDEAATIDPLVIDTTGGGAYLRLEGGTVYLEGDVANEEIAAEMLSWLDEVAAPNVNNLNIVPGAPAPSGRVVLADGLQFESGSDVLADVDPITAVALLQLANSKSDWQITIVGHTDNVGADAYNMDLSLRRATALRTLMIETSGFDPERVDVRGAGASEPIADNATEEGRSVNRRLEFEFRPAA